MYANTEIYESNVTYWQANRFNFDWLVIQTKEHLK